jgi:mevalonyl-CoA ligase
MKKLREFVGQTLGWHKVPVHIFWLEAGEAFPQTGAGKIKRHILRERSAKHILSSNADFH